MQDITLIKFLSNKDNFDRFRKYVKSHTVVRETEGVLSDFEDYWKMYPTHTDIDWHHFNIWFRMVKHAGWPVEKHDMFSAIFERVKSEAEPDDAVINKFIQLDYTAQVRDVCDRIIRGEKLDLDAAQPLLDKYLDELGRAGKTDEDYFVTSDIKSILDDMIRSHGMEWRLEDLNVSVGPLHAGDFVIVGARPETGKTTFLCSELTHMVAQLPENKGGIIFNNEEQGTKIMVRLVQAANNQTVFDIASDEQKSMDRYRGLLGSMDRIRVVHKDEGVSIYDIERYLKNGDYGIVGINILDKLRGYDRDESEVSRLRRLSQYIRNLANKYNVAIVAIMQADASGEGQAWLDLSKLYGSKTGVQGEADVILMVGETGEDDTRYINVAKNKLPGGPKTQPKLRHGKFEVQFDPERARYGSKTY